MTHVSSGGQADQGDPEVNTDRKPLESKDWDDPGNDDHTRGIAPTLDRNPSGRPEHA
ncbi:hypothetical protein OG976_05660 [Mycobacterium sp. NBC_00419]|uniref:hypothetical protein n=1 Tax=Mycobacterium sp. NBC_00419 TaxID=2975989 RepID=UPI002E1C7809